MQVVTCCRNRTGLAESEFALCSPFFSLCVLAPTQFHLAVIYEEEATAAAAEIENTQPHAEGSIGHVCVVLDFIVLP